MDEKPNNFQNRNIEPIDEVKLREEMTSQPTPTSSPAPAPLPSYQTPSPVVMNYPSPPLETPPKQKNWTAMVITMIVLTLSPIVLYALLMSNLVSQAKNGVSGTEFMALVFIPLLYLVPVFLLVDLILALIYLKKNKPRGIKLVFPIAIIIIAVAVPAWYGWQYYYVASGNSTKDYYASKIIPTSEAISRINNCEVKSITESSTGRPPSLERSATAKWSDSGFFAAKDLAQVNAAALAASDKCGGVKSSKAYNSTMYSALSVAQATDILNACKVVGFYYPGSKIADTPADIKTANSILNTNGILLVSDGDNKPIRIHVAASQLAVMVPLARKAQTTCPDLQFWTDKGYEQRSADGTWK